MIVKTIRMNPVFFKTKINKSFTEYNNYCLYNNLTSPENLYKKCKNIKMALVRSSIYKTKDIVG